jgi:hypothetical protein
MDTKGFNRILSEGRRMVNGAHFLLYSADADADRAFFRDVLDLRAVDAGGGWLIFALPPAELGIHPGDDKSAQSPADQELLGAALYLMCDDLPATIAALAAKNVPCAPVHQAGWGAVTTLTLPSGGKIGLYKPTHPVAIEHD